MELERVKEELKERWKELIPLLTVPAKLKVNGQESYICPLCNHGGGGDGLTANPKSTSHGLKCFGCDFSGDIIDLYCRTKNVEFMEAVKTLANYLNIEIEAGEVQSRARDKSRELKARPDNYTEYYKRCRERLTIPEAMLYLKGRGISIETAQAAGIGYDPEADPAGSGHPFKRIIIPVTDKYYTARAILPVKDKKYKYVNPKGSSIEILNRDVLYNEEVQEVFICEGAFDALAIMEAGAAVIALNSASNAGKLIRELEEKPTKATLIITLDNDRAGNNAAEVLRQGLQRLNIPFTATNINGKYNDPAEHLQEAREAFIDAVRKATREAQAKPDNTSLYMQRYMQADLKSFKTDIKTGFSNFDKETGGLFPGLYILMAVSSQGKTTLALQLADNIAEAGRDVVIFSLEQSRLELVSKSLARIAAQNNLNTFVNAQSIMRQSNTYPKEREELQRAVNEYKTKYADRISIVEGNFNCDTSFIGNYLRGYIEKNKTTPVVIIDYLQILQPGKDVKYYSTKEAVDKVVTEVKRLSRELKTPIIGISSVNRAAYIVPLSMESSKESGNVEFTADVVLGLQLRCMTRHSFLDNDAPTRYKITSEESKKRPREMELRCYKNRYGRKDFKLYFDYYSRNDLFIACDNEAEIEAREQATDKDTPPKRKRKSKRQESINSEWIDTFTGNEADN